jgi:hypothetical protein
MNMINAIWEHAALMADSPHPVSFFGFPLPDLADAIPNPAPVAPPGVAAKVSTLLGWWKYGAIIAGVFGLIGCGAMMMLGRRNRSSWAAEGATGIPWVLFGLTVVALSSGIVAVFT